MNWFTNSLLKSFNYIENLWIGDDGKPSGKRVSGLFLTYEGVKIANQVINKGSDLANGAILSGALFSTALVFWGIAAYSQVQYSKQNPSSKDNQ